MKEQTEKTDKVNSSLKKKRSIRGTLEFKEKYIKRRREHRRSFIKTEKYKYILGKSTPLYTNLSLFLIISSKSYISHLKNLMTNAGTMLFDKKVSQGSSFKKEDQFNTNFFIAM